MYRLGIFMLALMLPALSLAQDKDAQEISRYVLTDAALAKYTRAVEKLRPLSSQIASCDEENSDSNEGNPDSITEMTARIDRVPAAKAAIQSAGLPTREFVVFLFATFQTGMAVWGMEQAGAKLPPGVSQANVNFYKANRAKIEGMPQLEDGCDDSSEEEEAY